MSIISRFAETPDIDLDTFNSSTDDLVERMRKGAYEICHAFGLEVLKVHSPLHNRQGLDLVTKSGLPCGSFGVEYEGYDGTEKIYRYRLTLPSINKQKSSAKSGRGTRDSTNIASLIRAIVKNKEAPSEETIVRHVMRGIEYSISSVGNHYRKGTPKLVLGGDLPEMLARHVLGIDTVLPSMYIDQLRQSYSEYQSKMSSASQAEEHIARFGRGMTAVCVYRKERDGKPCYFVGDAVFQYIKDSVNQVSIPGGLTRYNSLHESPIAPTVAMIKAYTSGQSWHDASNDLGFPREDKYHEPIDVSVGYSDHDFLWVAIPKEAE